MAASGQDKLILREGADHQDEIRFAGEVLFLPMNGSVHADGSEIVVAGADSVTVLIAAAPNFKGGPFPGGDPQAQCERVLANSRKRNAEQILDREEAVYQPQLRRMALHLGLAKDAGDNLPTDERVSRVSKGADDLGLQELYFQFARYLVAAGRIARKSAGHLGRRHRQSVGFEIHHQRQHRDEILAGRALGKRGQVWDEDNDPLDSNCNRAPEAGPLTLTQTRLTLSKRGPSSLRIISEREAKAKRLKSKRKTTDAAVVQDSLRPYAIADKLRTLRLRRSMGLAQLAEHTGFSAAMLSRLENGRLVPTLPTLTRIALVFSVGLDYFFSDPRKRHVVAVARRSERRQFPSDPKAAPVPWHFESLDFRVNERKLNGYLAHFHPIPQEKLVPHYHPGVELLYLIEGKLEMMIGVETFQLAAGDSVYFDAMQKHTYRSLVKTACTAMVVTTDSSR